MQGVCALIRVIKVRIEFDFLFSADLQQQQLPMNYGPIKLSALLGWCFVNWKICFIGIFNDFASFPDLMNNISATANFVHYIIQGINLAASRLKELCVLRLISAFLKIDQANLYEHPMQMFMIMMASLINTF